MKTSIIGDAFVITSDFTLDQLKKVSKFRPDALKLKGGEDGKQTLYTVITGDKPGGFNNVGAIFGSKAHDGSDKATITMDVNCIPGEDKLSGLAEEYGRGLTYLKKIEENLQTVIDEIDADLAAIKASITVG